MKKKVKTLETGWFKENNQWKYFNYETLKNIKFGEVSTTPKKLNEVIDEELLYKIYPELADFTISIIDDKQALDFTGESDADAIFNVGEKTISIVRRTKYDLRGDGNVLPTLLTTAEKQKVVHEISHLIQRVEGFPSGGNVQTILQESYSIAGIEEGDDEITMSVKLSNPKKNLTEEQLKILDRGREAYKKYTAFYDSSAMFENYRRLLEKWKQDLQNTYTKKFRVSSLDENADYAKRK